ncbi:MAG: phosphoglycerate mutase family protein [Melioribacteraceae bacterium]|jgi:broad specificity phosphatase PhoE|nr:phosphoglycerate mutase family protein [Melioribacteraceae bacterium]
MNIGLVRHFKVISPHGSKKLTSKEFDEHMSGYDIYPVKPNEINIDSNDWDICYASTLSRAQTTAQTVYSGKIISTPLIVEVPLSAFMKTSFKLHTMVWQVVGRIAWLFSFKSQKEGRPQTLLRINQFLELIEKSGHQNILIVSHGFFMKILARELKKRNFKGELEFSPKNGKLYRFQN